MPRWDLVYKWADPETQSLVDAVTSALENCDRKLTEAATPPPVPAAPHNGSHAEMEGSQGHDLWLSQAGAVPAAPHRPRKTYREDNDLVLDEEPELLAVPAAPPLDVERLTAALWGMDFSNPDATVLARKIAAKYARLSPDQEDGDAPK